MVQTETFVSVGYNKENKNKSQTPLKECKPKINLKLQIHFLAELKKVNDAFIFLKISVHSLLVQHFCATGMTVNNTSINANVNVH